MERVVAKLRPGLYGLRVLPARCLVLSALSLCACRLDYDARLAGATRSAGASGVGADDGGSGRPSGGGSGSSAPAGGAGSSASGDSAGSGAGAAGTTGGGTGSIAAGATAGGAGGNVSPPNNFHASILHRYAFDGTGTEITDSIGGAHGTAIHCAVASGGVDFLATESDGYVQLPSGLLADLSEVTMEAWLLWRGGNRYQRILDFGANTGGSVPFFFVLSPSDKNSRFAATANFTSAVGDATNDWEVEGTAALPTNVVQHVAVTYDGTGLQIFRQGVSVGRLDDISAALSDIDDSNNLLGCSQFSQDPRLDGVLYEFRIYGSALTAAEIQASFESGQNP